MLNVCMFSNISVHKIYCCFQIEACLKEEDYTKILLDKLQFELAEKAGTV